MNDKKLKSILKEGGQFDGHISKNNNERKCSKKRERNDKEKWRSLKKTI